MEVIIVSAILICAWAMLRVMGNERERRTQELSLSYPAQTTPPPAEPEKPPVRSKVAR